MLEAKTPLCLVDFSSLSSLIHSQSRMEEGGYVAIEDEPRGGFSGVKRD